MATRLRAAPKHLLVRLAELPRRYPLAISGGLLALTIGLVVNGALSFGTQREVNDLRPQVTQIVRAAAACNRASLTHPRLAAACAERIRIGLENCRAVPVCRRAAAVVTLPPSVPVGAVPAAALGADGPLATSGGEAAAEGGSGAQGGGTAPKGGQPGKGGQTPQQQGQGGDREPLAATPEGSPAPQPGGSGSEAPAEESEAPAQEEPTAAPKALEVCALGACAEAGSGSVGVRAGDETPVTK